MEDAFTVDTFVYGAPLHDDGYSQQDLLAHVLLETGKKNEWNHCCEYKIKPFGKKTPEDKPRTPVISRMARSNNVEMLCIHSCSLLSLAGFAWKR